MSTGVSIKNLMNLIYGSPLKSFIPIIQSIGRILRLHKNKKYAKLFDFVDDLEYNGKSNHTLEHFKKRFGYYTEEGHDVEVKEFKL
jgi:superfamily II DNA or RNA helicase